MRELWRRLVNLGISPDCPRTDARHYKIANISLYLVLSASLLFFAFALWSGVRAWYVSVGIFIPLCSGVVIPRARGWHWFATAASLVLTILWLAFATVLLDSGSHYWLVPVSIGGLLMFPPRHTRAAWVFGGIVLATLILLKTIPFTPLVALDPALLVQQERANLVGALVSVLVISYYNRNIMLNAEARLDRERERSERLLLNVLPRRIADRLKQDEQFIAEYHDAVTVLFADIVGFTPMSAALSPDVLVRSLNEVFSRFDVIAARLELEKIKTIGDAYMVAGGVPEARDDHAPAVAQMALEMLQASEATLAANGEPYRVRIGMHSGPVVAGVIGRKKFAYDLWGEVVNLASRMESHGVAGRIQLSRETHDLLEPDFIMESRGEIEVKGVGEMETFLLLGRREGANELR